MKILFIDNKSIQNSIRIGLLEQMAHHDVRLIDDLEGAMEFFASEAPEMVLIDFSVEFAREALSRILEIDPQQAIISISDSLDCSEFLGCDFCLEHYNKKRLLKHQGIHDLLYLIENFEEMPCEFAHKFKECNSKGEEESPAEYIVKEETYEDEQK